MTNEKYFQKLKCDECERHEKEVCKNMVTLGKFFGKRAGHKSHCGCPFSEI